MIRPSQFFALALLVAATSLVHAQNVATVNNKPIPKSREEAWVKQLTQQGQQDTPELRKMIKDELIRREVFLQEAQRRALAEKPDVKFQLDVARQNTLIQSLLRDELQRRPVTDADVQAEYDRQKKIASDRKEYKARHILVEKEEDAKGIIEQLKKGAKFEDLAKQSKDTGSAANGGELDWAGPEAYVKPFSEAMAKLEKGQTTEAPVQSQFGWHVIRLEDTRAAQVPEMTPQIGGQIREALQQQRVQAFVEDLRKKAKVQ